MVAFGKTFGGLLAEGGHLFGINADGSTVRLEVKNGNRVKLIYDFSHSALVKNQKKDVLGVHVELDITPDTVTISQCTVRELVQAPSVREAFNFLKDNQASIWQKIILFLKKLFTKTVDTDLQIENANEDSGMILEQSDGAKSEPSL